MLYLTLLWCTTMVVCLAMTIKSLDLCGQKTLRLSNVGETGLIVFDNTSLTSGDGSGVGCVLKIQSCSSCRIEIRPESKKYFSFFCETGTTHSKYCSLGCDYLNIFDMYYMNETNRYYQNWGQFRDPFHSESSSVFIMLCHGYSMGYSFELVYKVTEKIQTVVGNSKTSSSTGFLSSPFFPMGYAENHEVYEYLLTSTDPDDYIMMMFDDWHLSLTSTLYFVSSNKHGQFSGESDRPVIVSDKNQLRFSFSTGVSLTAGEARNYIGFRASYRFYKDRPVSQPKTNCNGHSYLMKSTGGRIDFSASSRNKALYDCLWVVKTQDGFDGIYMKIIRFRTNGYLVRGENQIVIRAGVSSLGLVKAIADMIDNVNNGISHFATQGFYIRLNASMSASDNVVIVYASYKKGPICEHGLFLCDNHRCIDNSLTCDGYDHCGDNSDEVTVCADTIDPWDKSYQYTITIGVIVPMVISVFLIMVICLLFLMIRRCRRARLLEANGSNERLRTVSEDVSGRRGRRRRRHRRGLFGHGESDMPPTYDEAMQNPPGWYLNVAFGNPVDPTLPQPPSYHEATGQDASTSIPNTSQRQTPGSPTSTDSSQSELTMCSGNISDSSSSSEAGSTWGTYTRDGDGRRGRLGRHVSSSESETGTHERQVRSTATSPEENVSRSASTATAEQNSQSRDSKEEESQNVEHEPALEKSDSQDKQKKVNNDSDDFVIPAGPKPGGSDEHILECMSEVNSIARQWRQDHDRANEFQNDSVSPMRFLSAASCNHSRTVSSGSEAAAELNKKPKKKPRKSKMKKTKNHSVDSSELPEQYIDPSCNEHLSSEGASNILDVDRSNYHEMQVRTDDIIESPRRYEQIHQLVYPEQTIENSPKSSSDLNLDFQVVVNVDNDEVLVVYDSEVDRNATPLYLISSDIGLSDVPDEPAVNVVANGYEYDQMKPGVVDQEPEKYAADDRDFDDSVTSASQNNLQSHLPGSSDQLNVIGLFENGANRSSHQIHQPYISLRSDLQDMEDIYV